MSTNAKTLPKFTRDNKPARANIGITDVRTAARQLGGEPFGRNSVLCPGPRHSRADRSLHVSFESGAPEGFIVRSYAGDDFAECRDHVKAVLGIERELNSFRPEPRPTRPPLATDNDNRPLALAVWAEAVDPLGTLVERYLAGRKLRTPPDAAGRVIRFHPACPFGRERAPAMICAMRSIVGDEITGIHRRRLTEGGNKIGTAMMLGNAGVIKVDPDEVVTQGLGIAEGVETALQAREWGWRPVWAAGSAGAIGRFPVLAGVESLVIFGENDAGTNAKEAAKCSARWVEAGRDVRIHNPPDGYGDLNDFGQARGRAA
jgi:hypothetical protein